MEMANHTTNRKPAIHSICAVYWLCFATSSEVVRHWKSFNLSRNLIIHHVDRHSVSIPRTEDVLTSIYSNMNHQNPSRRSYRAVANGHGLCTSIAYRLLRAVEQQRTYTNCKSRNLRPYNRFSLIAVTALVLITISFTSGSYQSNVGDGSVDGKSSPFRIVSTHENWISCHKCVKRLLAAMQCKWAQKDCLTMSLICFFL